jgi:hypothetical protein
MPARYNFLGYQAYGFDDTMQAKIPVENRDRYARAVLTIAAADGLSKQEAEYFANLSAGMAMPEELIERYLTYDTSSASLEELLSPLRGTVPGANPAPFLLYDAIKVASVDGYAEAERKKVAEAARLLGVSAEHVALLEGLVAAELNVRAARLAAFGAVSAQLDKGR